MTDSLGTPEKVAEARHKLAAVQEHNTETMLELLVGIRKSSAISAATLAAVSNVPGHLFTRFLTKEASHSLNQAASLLNAAIELMPVDEGEIQEDGTLIMPEPTVTGSEEIVEEGSHSGSGQYL